MEEIELYEQHWGLKRSLRLMSRAEAKRIMRRRRNLQNQQKGGFVNYEPKEHRSGTQHPNGRED